MDGAISWLSPLVAGIEGSQIKKQSGRYLDEGGGGGGVEVEAGVVEEVMTDNYGVQVGKAGNLPYIPKVSFLTP